MITNIFLSVIVCMVIMVIGNSISRAFALVGALSIIRFRTVIKDTKDIIYIFWIWKVYFFRQSRHQWEFTFYFN